MLQKLRKSLMLFFHITSIILSDYQRFSVSFVSSPAGVRNDNMLTFSRSQIELKDVRLVMEL